MNLRTARLEEEGWVNEQYAAVGFIPSDLAKDTVVIAELDEAPAGLGRLVRADNAYELGGMLVFERFRGRGVARAIIDELLRIADDRDVYCIPFAELEALYASAGFIPCDNAPNAVREKFAWCQTAYDKPVLLMKRGLTSGKTPDALP